MGASISHPHASLGRTEHPHLLYHTTASIMPASCRHDVTKQLIFLMTNKKFTIYAEVTWKQAKAPFRFSFTLGFLEEPSHCPQDYQCGFLFRVHLIKYMCFT